MDEMNMFIPQSIQTVVELQHIATVSRQIISPKDSKPVIGAVQDTTLGSYVLTSEKTHIDGKDAMNIMMYTNLEFDKLNKMDKKKIYTGKELFSMIIPDR